jgi:hypothetical protein
VLHRRPLKTRSGLGRENLNGSVIGLALHRRPLRTAVSGRARRFRRTETSPPLRRLSEHSDAHPRHKGQSVRRLNAGEVGITPPERDVRERDQSLEGERQLVEFPLHAGESARTLIFRRGQLPLEYLNCSFI